MRLCFPILFLTLVLTGPLLQAAPKVELQLEPISLSPQKDNEPVYASERTERNWSLRTAFLGGATSEARRAERVILYGLRYDVVKKPLSAWQLEVMVGKDNFIHWVYGKKNYFPLETVTMPYYKFSLGEWMDSTEGLGSIVNIKKLQALAAVGLDDVFQWDQRLQLEIGAGLALIGPQLEVSLGLAF